MPTIKIQHRLGELILTEQDVILFRNNRFSLVTQTYNQNNMERCYEIQNSICNKLIREGKLIKVMHDDNGNFYKLG